MQQNCNNHEEDIRMTEEQRVVAEIDLDAIAFNIQNIRKLTSKETKIMGVVKADAYGHGAVQVSKVLLENGADWLAVAVLPEAVQLRNHGVDAPILVLGYTPEQNFSQVLDYDLMQTVFSFQQAEKFSQAAVEKNKTGIVHLKIDTGMGRIGFLPGEFSEDEILKIADLPSLEINGIYTHFSTADEADKTFTKEQKKKFLEVIESLERKGLKIPVKHAANSAGIMNFDDLYFNMVRPGIIMYGYYPSDEVDKNQLSIRPAMSVKSHISFIKEVEAGVPIGYGRTFVTGRKSKIATIPVGYADGYIRKMKEGGRVLIHGQYAPVVGRICMDQFMVDITELEEVKEGDEAVLLGRQGKNIVTADEIADILGTISYEVVCSVSKRVPRVYIKNGKVTEVVDYIL